MNLLSTENDIQNTRILLHFLNLFYDQITIDLQSIYVTSILHHFLLNILNVILMEVPSKIYGGLM